MRSAFADNTTEVKRSSLLTVETCYKKLFNLFYQHNYTSSYQICLGTLYCIKQYYSLRLIQQLLTQHKITSLLFASFFNLGQRAQRPVLAIGLNVYEAVSLF